MSFERIRRSHLKSQGLKRSENGNKPGKEDTPIVKSEALVHQALTADDITPDNVLALQRMYGNQATQRLLGIHQTPEGAALQTKLVPAPRVRKTGESFISTFTRSRESAYQKAQAAGISNKDLASMFQALLDSTDEYTYMQMESIVATQIENQTADTPQSTREVAYGGVKVTPTSKSLTVQNGQTTTNNGLDQQIHSKWILIDMDFLIESPDEHVEDWELGFHQTVTASDRSMLVIDHQQQNVLTKLVLPGPRRDGGSDTLMPWFQADSVALLGKQKVQAAHIHFEDRPGFGLTLNAGDQLRRMNGRDDFKLILALRKKDGSDIKILHTWVWHADYDTLAGDAALGITVDADGPGGNMTNLVFDGTRARHAFTAANTQLTMAQGQLMAGASLPNQAAFQEMKTKAKKKHTLRSAMLPVKTYGKLVTEFNNHVANSRWTQAKSTIDTLRQKLDLMNNKGTDYWLTTQLKTQYFDPIYNAVQQQQLFVNGKVGG